MSKSIQENKPNVNIIWFDSSENTNDEIKNAKDNVQQTNNSVLCCSSIDRINQDIESANKENTFLIISGISGNDTDVLLQSIHDTPSLNSIFVFSTNPKEDIHLKFQKVHIWSNSTKLIDFIKEAVIDLNKQMPMLSFHDQHQQCIVDLSEELQLFNDVILHLPPDDAEAKKEMIEACCQYSQHNQSSLEEINDFKRTYVKKKSIQWYTEDKFLYKIINRALRTEDIEQLYRFRYYIANLSSELRDAHQLQKSRCELKCLYRGTKVTKKEAEILKTSQGKLMAVNVYWSTSCNESCAFAFINGYKNYAYKTPVLFKIEHDSQVENDSVVFADLTPLGLTSKEEMEVLFDIGVVFKIESVSEERREKTDILVVQMKTSSEGREVVDKYKEENQKKMEDESPTIRLCTLFIRIGNVEKSLQLLKHLELNPGNENKAHIHRRMGIAYKVKKKYELALEHLKKAYELIRSSEFPQPAYAARILRNRSQVYDKMKEFKQALSDSEEALEIFKNKSGKEGNFVAKLYSTIGRIYYHQNYFDEALQYQLKALDIRNEHLSSEHLLIAFSYSDIAEIYSSQNDHDQALKYHLQALEIRKKSLPPDHHNIAWSLHQISKIYGKKQKSDLALEYHCQSLEIIEKCRSSSLHHLHIDILKHISNLVEDSERLGSMCKSKGNPDDAIKYYKVVVKIREQYLSDEHAKLASNVFELASVYDQIGDYTNALEYYSNAMKIYTENFKNRSTTPYWYRKAESNITRIKPLINQTIKS